MRAEAKFAHPGPFVDAHEAYVAPMQRVGPYEPRLWEAVTSVEDKLDPTEDNKNPPRLTTETATAILSRPARRPVVTIALSTPLSARRVPDLLRTVSVLDSETLFADRRAILISAKTGHSIGFY